MPKEINDAFAYNAAYNTLLRLIGERDAHAVLDAHPSVRWERDVNGRGVPVRRYVLRGEWEVDPEARVPQRSHPCMDCTERFPSLEARREHEVGHERQRSSKAQELHWRQVLDRGAGA